jgi:very-short-patch-repair endonuclease
LCHGAYLRIGSAPTERERALARLVAVHERLTGRHWFSHESAALLWGLPTWRTPTATHVRQIGRPGAARDRTIARHTGDVDPALLTNVSGLPVTDLSLTVLDCARRLRPLGAMVVADAALRAGVDRSAVLTLLDSSSDRSGTVRARGVVTCADGGAESAQETASRFVLLRAGLPIPSTQVPVETRSGTFWADLGFAEWRVLIEYDGRAKYTGREQLVREKRRHDAIVEAGWQLVRVTSEDLRDPDELVSRVRRLLPAGLPLTRRPWLRS